MKCYKIFVALLLVSTVTIAQKEGDTTIYEFVNLYSNGDTSLVKMHFINDSVLVWQEYFGRSLDLSTISPSPIDTFIVHKDKWSKIYNGKSYDFLSKNDFNKRKKTFEYTKSESPPNLRNRYTPVKKIRVDGDEIYVYNLDALQGNHELYHDTRVYFSFKYGIIGYINLSTQMLMKQFVGKLKMELR